MRTLSLAAVFALMISAMPAVAEESLVIQIKRMSMDTAMKIAKASVDACREKGIQIGVSVVDRDGIPQVVLRDTIAPPITLPISKGKAYAAVMFSVATSELKIAPTPRSDGYPAW